MKELELTFGRDTIADLYVEPMGDKVEASSCLFLTDEDYATICERAGINANDVEEGTLNVYFGAESAVEGADITDLKFRLTVCAHLCEGAPEEYIEKEVEMTVSEQNKLFKNMELYCEETAERYLAELFADAWADGKKMKAIEKTIERD